MIKNSHMGLVLSDDLGLGLRRLLRVKDLVIVRPMMIKGQGD